MIKGIDIVNLKEQAYLLKLGQRIRTLRLERGFDQKSFAFDCDIGRTQLYMIENGKTNPRLLTLLKIAAGFGMTLAEFLGEGVD
ncbi:MAG: helix-turn-helix transcriptional regulator [Bacteroidota bacterium]